MKRWLLLLALASSALLVAGADAEVVARRETQYFPALSYGHNRWTSIRLENISSLTRSVEIEAHRDDGSPMEVSSPVMLGPGDKTEIRLAETDKGLHWCWAKITTDEPTKITVAIEVLKGNRIEQFERKGLTPTNFGAHRWVNRSGDTQGKQLYYLNTSSSGAILTFCQADNPRANCESVKPKFGINGKASVLLPVRKLFRSYSIAETSDEHGGGLLMYLNHGSGRMKTFGTESSITFGSEVKDKSQ